VLGISVLVLTILRLAWWWLIDRKPLPPADMPRWQSRAATSVHGLFYVVILVMAASGIGMLVVSQAAQVLFFGAPRPLPDFDAYAPRIPHGIGGRLMVALICLHVAAALYHQFIRRDRLLRRMGLGR